MDYNQAWLSYNPVKQYKDKDLVTKVNIVKNSSSSEITKNIVKEYEVAFKKMLSVEVEVNEIEASQINEVSGIVVVQGTENAAEYLAGVTLVEQGYSLQQVGNKLLVIGYDENGILYGSYDVIRHVALNKGLSGVHKVENPKNRFRMLNHWDNLEGDIERGYSGNSFFFENDVILVNQRTVDYARMVASVGINAVVINNVNVRGEAASSLIMDRYLDKVKEIADIFAGYGIKLYVSANFAAPLEFGGVGTADPLDEGVATWWKECVANLYAKIPHFGGFLIKADSEGRPGPFTYNRTHADGANVLARALKPFGGTLIWRCFVYNCQQDWRDYKTDRARAAYDHFTPLDGLFDENVILQIKNGPMDFQVREPISPLFGSLKKTNMMLEVQIAQEYTGQQKHVCYLIPMFKEILAFNTYATEGPSTIADIVSGRTYNQVNCGIAAVTNTGNDYNWTGHDLAGANLYGYSRLIWNTDLTAEEIAEEWVKQVFPHDEKVEKVVMDILMGSWSTYEKYTSPLGIGWMVNPNHHYGVNVDGYEYDKWGTYHRADRNGLGVDRTINGTGYASQYNEPNASMYEKKETCPEELLLFFHYVRYDYVLKTGKTLIQHIYDTHFEGVEELEAYIEGWKSLKDKIPTDIYERVSARFQMQLEGAIEWRDRVNTYFYRKSGVDDKHGRKIYY